MEFLAWLQDTTVARWIAESASIWAYPTILFCHTLGLGLLAGSNAVIDLRLLGVAPRLPVGALKILVRPFWTGLGINAVSGILLFMPDAIHKAGQKIFFLKLGLILLAVIVFILIRPYVIDEEPGHRICSRARTMACVSLILWTGAITAGRLMAYV